MGEFSYEGKFQMGRPVAMERRGAMESSGKEVAGTQLEARGIKRARLYFISTRSCLVKLGEIYHLCIGFCDLFDGFEEASSIGGRQYKPDDHSCNIDQSVRQ